MKFCKDCTHYSPQVKYRGGRTDYDVCGYKPFQKQSPNYIVTGQLVSPSALLMRNIPNKCGWEAKYYDPKIL